MRIVSISQIFENAWPLPAKKICEMEPQIETRAPEPQPATKQLQAGLERAAGAYRDREQTLLREIADRQAELADVRHALNAASTALIELGMGEVLSEGPGGVDLEPAPPWMDEDRATRWANGRSGL